MAQARPRVECPAYDQAKPNNQGRVFDAPEHVAASDADELTAEQLAHGHTPSGGGVVDERYDTKVKIGEALEAAARAVGDHSVERSDAAAIRAAETRAVGQGVVVPGGVAERAQAAADANARAAHREDKVTITDVLRWNATAKLPTDKAVTREDAAAVAEAEAAVHDPAAATNPYGVGAALTAAARHNQEDSS